MSQICLEEFEKNLKRIKFNENNKDISKKLDVLSCKLKDLSVNLQNNINTNEFVVNEVRPAGHTGPVRNNSHTHFTNSLRSW
jgi:hypothetical protein